MGIDVSCQQLMNKYQRLLCLTVAMFLTYHAALTDPTNAKRASTHPP